MKKASTKNLKKEENIIGLHSSKKEPQKFKSKIQVVENDVKQKVEKIIYPLTPLIKSMSEVKSTTNYEMFDLTDYSRDRKEKHLISLKESMGKYGQLIVAVVVRVRDKKSKYKYRVLEGHHRWYEVQELCIPFLYIVYEFEDEEKEQIFYDEVNTRLKALSDIDFQKKGVVLKNPNNRRADRLMRKYSLKQFEFSTIHGNMRGANFRRSDWKFTKDYEKEVVERITQMEELLTCHPHIIELCKCNKGASGKKLKTGIIRIIRDSKYDHQRMIRKINENANHMLLTPKVLNRTTNATMFVLQLEEIYNKGETPKNQYKFSMTQN